MLVNGQWVENWQPVQAVDHEGGRVQRCKADGFTHLSAMRKLGELWMEAPKNSKTTYASESAITAMTAATGPGLAAISTALKINWTNA